MTGARLLLSVLAATAALGAANASGQPAPAPAPRCRADVRAPTRAPDCRDGTPRAAAPAPPRFEDFPATGGPPPRNAPLVLTRRDLAYRTRLREAAGKRPDFAGHYVMVTWGCGTECLMGAAINARTGRVTFLPFATCCLASAGEGRADMLAFRPDSDLLVLIGIRDPQRGDEGAHYYRIQGDRFVHVRSVRPAARR